MPWHARFARSNAAADVLLLLSLCLVLAVRRPIASGPVSWLPRGLLFLEWQESRVLRLKLMEP
jgi:hypothetical protein